VSIRLIRAGWNDLLAAPRSGDERPSRQLVAGRDRVTASALTPPGECLQAQSRPGLIGERRAPRRQLAKASRAGSALRSQTIPGRRRRLCASPLRQAVAAFEVVGCGSAIRVSRKKSKSWRKPLRPGPQLPAAASNHQPRQRSRPVAVPPAGKAPPILADGQQGSTDGQAARSAGVACGDTPTGPDSAPPWDVWWPFNRGTETLEAVRRQLPLGASSTTSDGRTKWPVSPILKVTEKRFASRHHG